MMAFVKCLIFFEMAYFVFCKPVHPKLDIDELNQLGKRYNFGYKKMRAYLIQFHYMGPNSPNYGAPLDPAEEFSQAVALFQEFFGLKITGVMNLETLHWMVMPRCGVPDFIKDSKEVIPEKPTPKPKPPKCKYYYGCPHRGYGYHIKKKPQKPNSQLKPQKKPKQHKQQQMQQHANSKTMNTNSMSHKRSKRFTVHEFGPWKKNNLTYKITNMPPRTKAFCITNCKHVFLYNKQLEKHQVHAAIDRAFNEWAKISILNFQRVMHGNPDIKLSFVETFHRDGVPFDGPNGTLAHAFWPFQGGDTHFDNSEYWTLDTPGKGVDLFQVAVHELGHALGLGHTTYKRAVMFPTYEYRDKWRFHWDDEQGIEYLYELYENK